MVHLLWLGALFNKANLLWLNFRRQFSIVNQLLPEIQSREEKKLSYYSCFAVLYDLRFVVASWSVSNMWLAEMSHPNLLLRYHPRPQAYTQASCDEGRLRVSDVHLNGGTPSTWMREYLTAHTRTTLFYCRCKSSCVDSCCNYQPQSKGSVADLHGAVMWSPLLNALLLPGE